MNRSVLGPLLKKTLYFNNQPFRTSTVISNAVANEEEALKSWREIPGPSSLPLLGPIHHFMPGGSFYKVERIDIIQRLGDKYGPIVRLDSMGTMGTIIILYDPESSIEVLRGEEKMPYRPTIMSAQYYKEVVKKKKYAGLLVDGGQSWREQRTIANPIMMQSKVIKLYSEAVDEITVDSMERIRSIRHDENKIKNDFFTEINLWALEAMGMVALGGRIGCLAPNLPEDSPARRMVKVNARAIDSGRELDFEPSLWRYIPTPAYKRAMQIYEEQEKLAKYFIDKSCAGTLGTEKLESEMSILEKLMKIDKDIAYIMAADSLAAGIDTVSQTLLGALYLLGTNVGVQNKLREELKVDPDNRTYLRACIKESMRIMPGTSGNIRKTQNEYNLHGYKIPRNTLVVFQLYSAMLKRFPRPLEFIPERWLADKSDPLYYGNVHPLINSNFGYGVRSCIGRRIAEMEMETFLRRFVGNFHIEWNGPPPKVCQRVTNQVMRPHYFKITEVSK